MTNHTHLTTDLVRDLRERVVGHPRLMTEAADEIERLERERDEMSVLAVRDGREVERLMAEVARLRAAFRVNALRWAPHLTHEEIDRVIAGR
ncbi:MAG: hypothetical protein M0Z28_21055 [Rhodospirillales bacterium]|nr:hypothetical protein [Rhodospirillales bacterium]